MDLVVRLILIFPAFAIGSTDDPGYEIFPSKASVVPGEGLVLKAFPNNISLATCQIQIANLNWKFTDTNTEGSYTVSYWGNGVSKGECGVKIGNYDPAHHKGTWRFTLTPAKSDAPLKRSESKTVAVDTSEPPVTPKGKVIDTFLGDFVVIDCFSPHSLHCVLLDPVGIVHKTGTNCTAELASVRMKDVGVWQCQTNLKGIAEIVNTNFTIKVGNLKTIELDQIKTEKELNLQCILLSANYTATDCQFERPDGKLFLLQDGANSGRYTYYGKGIQSGVCGISIDLPLAKEDVGLWSCKVHLSSGLTTGGFLVVNPEKGIKVNKTAVILNSVYSTNDLTLRNGSELIIGCSTRSSLKYCWLRHPNGSRFTPHPTAVSDGYEYVGDGLELGQCGMKIAEATVLDSGLWSCGLGVDSESGFSKDIQTYVNVLVAVDKLIANRSSTTVAEGDWVILGCRSLLGEGLKYCSFVAPDGTGYSLTKTKESYHPRYSYAGNGLENGDCGLLINPVTKEDYGNWKCASMLIDFQDSKEYYLTLALQAPGFSTSSAVGIALGVAVVLVMGIIIFVWHHRRKHRSEIEQVRDERPAEAPLSFRSEGTEFSDDVEMFSVELPQQAEASTSGVEESRSSNM